MERQLNLHVSTRLLSFAKTLLCTTATSLFVLFPSASFAGDIWTWGGSQEKNFWSDKEQWIKVDANDAPSDSYRINTSYGVVLDNDASIYLLRLQKGYLDILPGKELNINSLEIYDGYKRLNIGNKSVFNYENTNNFRTEISDISINVDGFFVFRDNRDYASDDFMEFGGTSIDTGDPYVTNISGTGSIIQIPSHNGIVPRACRQLSGLRRQIPKSAFM